MIAKLTGVLDTSGEDWAVIDVGGVGYLVFCSSRTLGRIAGIAGAVSLYIETHVREDHIHLYGFADASERQGFRLLTTVQGVGAKVALGILSVLTTDALAQAVAAGDKAAVSQAQGVGPKLAMRIVTELKDKVGGIALGAAALATGKPATDTGQPADGGGAASADAVSALVNLGYGRSEALSAVAKAAQRLGSEAELEALIRDGLGELGALETHA
ncbi:MAG: Holliday junction branch migration protein RuvA [Rhodospirillales bacterium]|jgi:Holliday junction DNA helicase RuvA|nr:Holliday junction branch migration protein RuvA [Rhodospirillaceae bacterium]MDP6429949.1 Holliday junction branch migration protein RuvA [Rhodospirillales bacterium]MDP6646768.1 Holliday junction branch migration protein RuvA [Rhodospirillales bacterium]MDP6843467.1 Holliday junction branch migration protein RuvA [Rhodospirillales bacterium]